MSLGFTFKGKQRRPNEKGVKPTHCEVSHERLKSQQRVAADAGRRVTHFQPLFARRSCVGRQARS